MRTETADFNFVKEEMVGATSNSGFRVGEQDSSELEECLLRPDSRAIEQITIEDQKKAEDLLEIFMGPEIEPRREYIILYSEKARD